MAGNIALQLYTLRDSMQNADEIKSTVEKVAAIGYRYVEHIVGFNITPEEMRRVCDDNGIAIVATHIGFEAMQEDLAAVIAVHETLGATFAGVGGMPGEYRTSGEGFAEFARLADEVGARLKEAGLHFNYHNHSFEFQRFGDKNGMEILTENSSGENVKNELDTYWIQHGGGSPEAWISQLAGRCPVVHFKDMGIADNTQYFAEVGEGNLNWPGILDACSVAGVQYCVVEQDRCQRDPFESVAISFNNLKAMGLD